MTYKHRLRGSNHPPTSRIAPATSSRHGHPDRTPHGSRPRSRRIEFTRQHEKLLDAIPEPLRSAHIREQSEGLVFTWVNPDGTTVDQVRPDAPVADAKYLFPKGANLPVGVAQGMRDRVLDPSKPLIIVEGTKQYLAASAAALARAPGKPDYAVVGISGCWNWGQDGSPLGHWKDIPLEGREVFVAFDADVQSKHQVWEAADRLRSYLEVVEGTKPCRWVRITGASDDGFDDFLSHARDPVGAFHRLVAAATSGLPKEPRRPRVSPAKVANDILSSDADLALGLDETVLVYRDGKYHSSQSRLFDDLVQRFSGDRYSVPFQRDVESIVATRLAGQGRRIPVFQKCLLIPFLNGLLDPRTMVLHPHDPTFMTTRVFQVEWDPQAKAPLYEQWAAQHLRPGVLDDLEEVVSQMLDLTRAPGRAAFLFGPSRSGKGTFSRLIEELAGRDNTSAVSLHDLAQDKFAAADLYGKTLNVHSDLSADEVSDLSKLKMALGEDLIRAQRKFGQPFTFENTALMVFAANEVPAVSEASKAYHARVKPFEFPVSFIGQEDPQVGASLRAELPGIAVRWVAALGRRLERGRFLPTDEATEASFRLKSDRVLEFITERYILDDRERLAGSEVLRAYQVWSSDGGQKALGRTKFYSRLANLGVTRVERQSRPYFGLRERPYDEGIEGFDEDPPAANVKGLRRPRQISSPDMSNSEEKPSKPSTPGGLLTRPVKTRRDDFRGAGPESLSCVVVDGQRGLTPGDVMHAVHSGQPVVAHHGFNRGFVELAETHGLDYLAASESGQLIDSLILDILNDPPEAGTKNPTARYTSQSRNQESPPLSVVDGLDDYAKREMRIMGRLAYAMRIKGWRVDTELLTARIHEAEATRRQARDFLVSHGFPALTGDGSIAARPHATQSGQEVLQWLFARSGVVLKSWMTGNRGELLTSGRVWTQERVQALPGEVQAIIRAILTLNETRSVYSNIQQHLIGDRVFPTILPIQASGRFSIQNPGLTVMGKSKALVRERAVLLPDTGEVLVSFDLNQIDARAVAMHCQDPAYKALFTDPTVDSHAEIARMVWGDRSRRQDAKAIAHGWNYGEGVHAIARSAGVDTSVVEQFDQQMRSRFPGLVEWQEAVRAQAASGSLLDNGMGRKMRPTPDRSHTQGPALMGQGLARDLLMEGVLRLHAEHIRALRGVIHDELVFSVRKADRDGFIEDVLAALQFEFRGVPVNASLVGVGDNWSACYEPAV